METVQSISDLLQLRNRLPSPVGLVPTMGYLHEGHLSLVDLARHQNSSVVTTIFVNPTQFGPQEDLEAYPRDIPRDLTLLEERGVDLVWIPESNEMYPPGFQTWVTVDEITKTLEGKMRPGHFRGVTTIVAKLFNAVQPDKAYFGQKDAQQAVVLRRMVMDLNFPVEIVVGPIVRESDGLAMSSRNVYLDPAERQAATILYKALKAGEKAFEQGNHDADKLREIMTETISREELAHLQYVSCADMETLDELNGKITSGLLSLAVYIGKTRLIDNILLGV
ncbi:MAG: pantoate--beta-alanine ligase [Anaerolineales bacterium]